MPKSRKEEEKYVKVCPACNSIDVAPDFTIPAAIAAGGLYMFRCNRCDYVSTLFPEFPINELPEPIDLDKIEKDYQTVDTSFGKGSFALLKLLAPLGLIISLFVYYLQQSPLFMLGIIIHAYLTLYVYGRNYFNRYRVLRIAGVAIIILYVIFYFPI
ncbi:MAG: hypothetical protein ACLFVX_05800 [Archaeoglobaceae archaeon]